MYKSFWLLFDKLCGRPTAWLASFSPQRRFERRSGRPPSEEPRRFLIGAGIGSAEWRRGLFIRTPDAKTVKNRVHLDLRRYPGDDQAAEVARLSALGAVDINVGQGDGMSWTCLADPEGNEFDVLTPR
jgi:Glyoxalase-like domain